MNNGKQMLCLAVGIAAAIYSASAHVVTPGDPVIVPRPVPVFIPKTIGGEEKPVIVETKESIAEDNGLCRRVETTIIFTNPNRRVFEGELEFPLPEGATVCGYALEINGNMVPGVVCEKEKARVAFENEKRKGIDPGIVENVKGNVWRTRIYPLNPNTPRKAMVAYVVADAEPVVKPVFEKDGDDVFVGEQVAEGMQPKPVADRLRASSSGWILWDASFSRKGKTAADRNLLECLPEKGDWTLVVFRDVPEAPVKFTSRAELLKAIDAVVYDGGTSFEKLASALGGGEKFLFTDEVDTLSVSAPDFESDESVVFASRPPVRARKIRVRKLAKDEKPSAEPKESKLLATVWAADRVADLSSQAGQRKEEFLTLGRKYGIAGPDTSLIVLERLDQYLAYKIEPPESMSFYREWKRRRAADDDPIAAERARADHRQRLLSLWEERVRWWNDPIPPKKTPSSGLFRDSRQSMEMSVSADDGDFDVQRSAAAPRQSSARRAASMTKAAGDFRSSDSRSIRVDETSFDDNEKSSPMPIASSAPVAPSGPRATVKIAAWDPKMPYLKAIGEAASGCAYSEYLKQRETYGGSPAFYLDCSGWFFKAKDHALGCRIISNLAEMKLEDVGLWRTMGWRLREAGAYDLAVDVFRHVLAMRGEEAQSKRDLALVLTERGKIRFDAGAKEGTLADLAEAAKLLQSAAFEVAARRSARRSNDMQTSVLALEELNGLLAWAAAKEIMIDASALDAAFRRDLPLDLRIVMSWDTDETDIDIHVLEPGGEEAYYSHRRTSTGGFVSEDVTTGYGPEEYLKKKAEPGVYKVLSNYFASHRQQLSGAATVTATVYTGWATKDEKRQVLSFRLDRAKDRHPIGEIEIR